MTCQGAPNARASRTSHSESAVAIRSPTNGDQANDAVDAIADLGAWQDEGNVQQFGHRLQPGQPLAAAQLAKQIDPAQIEAKLARSVVQEFPRDLAAVLVDDRPARLPGAEIGAVSAPRMRLLVQDMGFFHSHQVVTPKQSASCVISSGL